MPIYELDHTNRFPPVHLSEPDGLLAIGGDLSPSRLLNAYRSGIFPWYNEPPILWYCPDPRFVLFPGELYVSKSMLQLFKKKAFVVTINKCFAEVMRNCKTVPRKDQDGTWISEEIIQAYSKLHEMGLAHSVEVWKDSELVGGLYGVLLGKVFFGESMFSRSSNASKYGFLSYVHYLQEQGVAMIDCQIYSEHLASLGARMIERNLFISLLDELIPKSE